MCCLLLCPGGRHQDWHRNRPAGLQPLPISLRLPIRLSVRIPVLPTVSVLLRLSVSRLRSAGPGLRAARSGLPTAASTDVSAGDADVCSAGRHGTDERVSWNGPWQHAASTAAAADAHATIAGGAATAADASAAAYVSAVGCRSAHVGTAAGQSAGSDSRASRSAGARPAGNVRDSESAGMIVPKPLLRFRYSLTDGSVMRGMVESVIHHRAADMGIGQQLHV